MKRILIFHNRYRWPGGEDQVVAAEAELLRAHGHDVEVISPNNDDILKQGAFATLKALWQAPWSKSSYQAARDIIGRFRPDLVHLHNFWFTLTPSVLSAAHDAGLPTVLTLHNLRLLCPAGALPGHCPEPCGDCRSLLPWRGLFRRCYRSSFWTTAALLRLLRHNQRRQTWQREVDLFLAPSSFCRERFVAAGLPPDKIVIKPHFTTDPCPTAAPTLPDRKPALLFVGRLSREKGLLTLLKAWKMASPGLNAELHIAGEGPLRNEISLLTKTGNVHLSGRLEKAALAKALSEASALVLPSECYETFGLVVIEAFAWGRPAVVSQLGGPPSLVRDGQTGLIFQAGNAADLAEKLRQLLNSPELTQRLGEAARQEYLREFTPERNYLLLEQAYRQAGQNRRSILPTA